MIREGGKEALLAWNVLNWAQACLWCFNLKNWPQSRQSSLLKGANVPSLECQYRSRTNNKSFRDGAPEWISRWICAFDIMNFWKFTVDFYDHKVPQSFQSHSMMHPSFGSFPEWNLVICNDHELVLFVDCQNQAAFPPTPSKDKISRKAKCEKEARARIDYMNSIFCEPCIWFHTDTSEWTTETQSCPAQNEVLKKHRLLPVSRKLWFFVYSVQDVSKPGRAFSARCCTLPIAATGQSAREAISNLKFATANYQRLQ